MLQLLVDGYRRDEIAKRLGKAPSYVRRSLENLRNRYAPTNESLIALAIVLGWVTVAVSMVGRIPVVGKCAE